MKRRLIITLTGLTLFACDHKPSGKETTPADNPGSAELQFRFDKRVETVYFVFMLTGEYDVLISRHPSSYKSAATKYFSKYKDSKVVQRAKNLMSAGFGADYAANWIFQFTDFPEFQKNNEVAFPFSALKIHADTLDAFRQELIAFYKESNCDSFFISKKDFLQEMISKAESSFSRKDLPKILEDYYGIKKNANPYVTLSPLLHAGGYGIECDNKTMSKKELVALIGPNGEIDFLPVFDNAFLEQDLIIHEFGHSYANEIIDQDSSLVKKYDNTLFLSVKNDLENEGIGKESFMYELIVRAVTIRIVENVYGKKTADKLMGYETSIGFKYMADVVDELKKYEVQRDKYPALQDFLPQIIKRVDSIKI